MIPKCPCGRGAKDRAEEQDFASRLLRILRRIARSNPERFTRTPNAVTYASQFPDIGRCAYLSKLGFSAGHPHRNQRKTKVEEPVTKRTVKDVTCIKVWSRLHQQCNPTNPAIFGVGWIRVGCDRDLVIVGVGCYRGSFSFRVRCCQDCLLSGQVV